MRLFGSRTDDSQRGDDIDLLVEPQKSDVSKLVRAELSMLADLQTQLGEQKTDVLLGCPMRQTRSAISSIAKETGILLC